MMIHLTETIRKYLGWCPNEETLKTNAAMKSEWLTPSTGRPDGKSDSEFGWYNRYHNQLLAMAVNLTLATIALFFLLDDSRNFAWIGIPIGITVGILTVIITLWHSWKRYDRIQKGEFLRQNEDGKQRPLRSVGIISVTIVLVAIISLGLIIKRPFIILAVFAGVGMTMWMLYVSVRIWEKRRRQIMIWEKNSLYSVDITNKKSGIRNAR